MREIKFRAWDKQTRNWLELHEIDKDVQWYNRRCKLYRAFFDTHVELMQYTGIQDKNGLPIYEGDIIEILDKNFRAVVVFSEGCFTVEIIGQDEDYSKCFCLRDLVAISPSAVIGNIWENPELLESEDEGK